MAAAMALGFIMNEAEDERAKEEQAEEEQAEEEQFYEAYSVLDNTPSTEDPFSCLNNLLDASELVQKTHKRCPYGPDYAYLKSHELEIDGLLYRAWTPIPAPAEEQGQMHQQYMENNEERRDARAEYAPEKYEGHYLPRQDFHFNERRDTRAAQAPESYEGHYSQRQDFYSNERLNARAEYAPEQYQGYYSQRQGFHFIGKYNTVTYVPEQFERRHHPQLYESQFNRGSYARAEHAPKSYGDYYSQQHHEQFEEWLGYDKKMAKTGCPMDQSHSGSSWDPINLTTPPDTAAPKERRAKKLRVRKGRGAGKAN